MATILFTASSSSYNCPQRVDLTEEKVQPTVRRLSEQSERRRSEARRLSEASIEKASMTERLSSVKQGRLPTNQQINACIGKFLNSRVIRSQTISEDGQLILKDIQDLLVAVQKALFIKNSDELFQSMIYHTKNARDSQVSEMDELRLGTFSISKIIKFLLFDDKFKNLLTNILSTSQNILEQDPKMLAPSSSKVDPGMKRDRIGILSGLRSIFTALRKNPGYRSPLETLLNLIILWTDRLIWANEIDPQEEQDLAASEAKELFERWTKNIQLDPFLKKLNDLACSVRNDPKLSMLYSKARDLSNRSLEEDSFDEKSWTELIDNLKTSDEVVKYRQTMTRLADEAQLILQSFKNDPISKEISEKLYSLHEHLWTNKTILEPYVLDDIKMTLLPALIEQITYIPLPQLTIQDNEQYEVIIDNMALPGDTLMPKAIELKVDDYLRFFPDSDEGSTSVQGLFIQLHGIQTFMEDVNFCYKRRAGFMGIKDSGIASVNVSPKFQTRRSDVHCFNR
ncbi:unnamed protein product [Rhizopus stolonifer]